MLRAAEDLTALFGSMARGDARPDSDVDFLVEFEPGRTVLDLSPSRAGERFRDEAVPM